MTVDSKLKLPPHPSIAAPEGPVVLIILDGLGVGLGDEFDAVSVASTPNLDALKDKALYRTLCAHGTAVGLPTDKDLGNSEVGHNILGAGRIFDQGAKCIDRAFESGAIWDGAWERAIARVKENNSTLHLMGLLSDGNVHSSNQHLYALINKAQDLGVARLRLHVLLDGRDVPDQTAEQYVAELNEVLDAVNAKGGFDYKIASGGGRMVTTMDRYEADWRIVERGWRAHVLGTATPYPSIEAALKSIRQDNPGISDQKLPAFTVCDDQGSPVGKICDGDAVIFFNYRGDRAIEISQAFTGGPEFDHFDRVETPDVFYAGMMLYDGDLGIPQHYLVTPDTVERTVSEYLCASGITQFACAETQKYGHVTYFWNGNRTPKFDEELEEYLEIPSDLVSFDERPWMKSAQTADAVIEAIRDGKHRFIRANFAGGDMVGHTGHFQATVIAVESLDLAMGRILKQISESKGCLLITADHGNADDMVEREADGTPKMDANGRPKWRTSHSLNAVPIWIVEESSRDYRLRDDLPGAGLANIASTVVDLLGLAAPEEYEPGLIRAD